MVLTLLYKNAACPIDFVSFCSTIVSSFSQFLKALSPSLVTLSPKEIFFSLLQESKADSPIALTLSLAEVKVLQSQNVSLNISSLGQSIQRTASYESTCSKIFQIFRKVYFLKITTR